MAMQVGLPALTTQQVKSLPVVPVRNQSRIAHGAMVPANIVYTSGGGLIPGLPADPDLAQALTVTTVRHMRNARLPNGLTRRADIMARLQARGASLSASYRAAYSSQQPDPIKVAAAAQRVARLPSYRAQVDNYRAVLEYEARQQVVGIEDFVKSRLVSEAQTARNDGARIRALELLGKTEGMFVDIKRTEKALSPKDLGTLKNELNQRLKDSLLRIAPQLAALQGLSHTAGTDIPSGEILEPETHPGHTPLVEYWDPPTKKDTIPPTGSPVLEHTGTPLDGTHPERPRVGVSDGFSPPGAIMVAGHPGSGLVGSIEPPGHGLVRIVRLGSEHREMGLDDL